MLFFTGANVRSDMDENTSSTISYRHRRHPERNHTPCAMHTLVIRDNAGVVGFSRWKEREVLGGLLKKQQDFRDLQHEREK